jgi:hypothetical protein
VPPPKNAEERQRRETENKGNTHRIETEVVAFHIKDTQSNALFIFAE